MSNGLTVFSPYARALGDPSLIRAATVRQRRRWCCKCSQEKPMKGGELKTGGKPFRAGAIYRFICASCQPQKEAS